MTEAMEKIDAVTNEADTPAADAVAGADQGGGEKVEDNAAAVDTAVATEGDDKATDEVKPEWPEDWREKLANGDEAMLKVLKRYSSPTTFAKGWKEREDLIRSGKLKAAKPDGTDEKAMAEWRKENGVPDDPTGYVIPDAVKGVLVDEDKPLVTAWFEDAHAAGMPQEMAAKGIEWYGKIIGGLQEQQAKNDKEARDAAEDALRKEWSHAEYKANTTLGARWLASTPLGETWADLRTPDGRRLGDNPDFMMWAADNGRQSFGDVSFATGDAERQHTARKEEIESIMKSDINRYFKEGLDKEYATILQKEQKRTR